MPTQRGNGIYYVKRRFKGIDPPLVYRSLATRSKTRARTLEDILINLHGQGRLDIVRAFQVGRIPVATMTLSRCRCQTGTESRSRPKALSILVGMS